MEAPTDKMSSGEFQETMQKHITEHYEKKGDDGYVCKKCGSEIQQTTMFVSIHYKEFSDCVGGGECKQIPLPYCPKCEGIPKKINTCVHV